MISFIIPAHNEASGIGRTLASIHAAAAGAGEPYEIVVVDDASTDGTAEEARKHGARVVPVAFRQISATRNAGARAAWGTRFFFVDADTRVEPAVLALALRAMERGAAGGGAWTRLEGPVPVYARILFFLFFLLGAVLGMTGGAFMFCTRQTFEQAGGFNEGLFWAEEADFSNRLKRAGRFAVLPRRLPTSGRRFQRVPGLQFLFAFVRFLCLPGRTLKRREAVSRIWYDSDRETLPRGWSAIRLQCSNAAALLILLVFFSGPVLAWIPWPDLLFQDWRGSARVLMGSVLIAGGMLMWPCSAFLAWCLFRQTRWQEQLRLGILLGICLWKASIAAGNFGDLWGRIAVWVGV